MKSFAIIATFLLTVQAFAGDWVRDKNGNKVKQGSKVKYYDKGTECEGQVRTLNQAQWKVTVNWYKNKSTGRCPQGEVDANDINAQDNK